MKNKTITLPDLKSGETYAGIVIDDKGNDFFQELKLE